jgi:hypothetical protein
MSYRDLGSFTGDFRIEFLRLSLGVNTLRLVGSVSFSQGKSEFEREQELIRFRGEMKKF